MVSENTQEELPSCPTAKLKLKELVARQMNPTDPAPLNMYEIRNYIFFGFSDDELRPYYWRILLDYCTHNKFKTSEFINIKRSEYAAILSEAQKENNTFEIPNIFESPASNAAESRPNDHVAEDTGDDADKSAYNTKLSSDTAEDSSTVAKTPGETETREDLEIQEQIREIIMRENKYSAVASKIPTKYRAEYVGPVINILQAYNYKKHGNISLEGMIHLLLPIYHALISSKNKDVSKFAEEDAYWLFNTLMAKMRDYLIEGSNALEEQVESVMRIMEESDAKLYEVLKKKDIDVAPFIRKWIRTLFSTDFNIDSVLWIWDRLLSDSYRFEMATYCSVAILILVRKVLIEGEPLIALMALNNIMIIDVEVLFDIADNIRRRKMKAGDYIESIQKINK